MEIASEKSPARISLRAAADKLRHREVNLKEMRNNEQSGRCILVCAGEFTPVEIERGEEDLLIAVDGGLSYLEQMGMLPDIAIGDFDSLPAEDGSLLQEMERADAGKVIRLPVAKDDTDTMAGIKLGLSRGYQRFFLYGALGGRVDHTMANMQTLLYLKKHGAVGYIMDAACMLLVIENETIQFHAGMEGILSLFSLDREIRGVTLQGLAFPLEDGVLTNDFPLGVSNQFLPEQRASVTVAEGRALIVINFKTEHDL